MANIMQAWRESLKMLLPRNQNTIFDKQIMRSTAQTYKILIVQFWWLILGMIGTLFYFKTFANNVTSLCVIVWLIVCYVAARPSDRTKDFAYFLSFWLHCIVALLIAALLGGVLILLNVLLGGIFGFSLLKIVGTGAGPTCPCCIFAPVLLMYAVLQPLFLSFNAQAVAFGCTWALGYGLVFIFYSLFILFTLLFLFDVHIVSLPAVLQSIKNGCKLVWYTYPFCFVIILPFQIISIFLFFWVDPRVSFIGFLLFPVYLHIFMYMYSKQLREYPGRYE